MASHNSSISWDNFQAPLIAVAAPLLVAAYPLWGPLFGLQPASGWRESFSVYFLAIVLEAVPFILLGAVVSGLMELWLPADLLPKLTAKFGPWGILLAALLAPLFPVCECGVVFVVRGLLRKGLPLPHAMTYLLAAPILNFTVLGSTYIAFQDWRYPLYRALGGLFVALLAGYVFSLLPSKKMLKPEPDADPFPIASALPMAEAGTGTMPRVPAWLEGWSRAAGRVAADFVDMMPYFLIGVSIAAAMKTFIPASSLAALGQGPVSGPLAMMSSAFVLSLCSEADAFVASSFTEFSFYAVMSFLVLGPMFDIKLLMMYRPVFSWRAVLLLALITWIGVAVFTAMLGVLL